MTFQPQFLPDFNGKKPLCPCRLPRRYIDIAPRLFAKRSLGARSPVAAFPHGKYTRAAHLNNLLFEICLDSAENP